MKFSWADNVNRWINFKDSNSSLSGSFLRPFRKRIDPLTLGQDEMLIGQRHLDIARDFKVQQIKQYKNKFT